MPVTLDTEVYPNYFLLSAMDLDTHKIIDLELRNGGVFDKKKAVRLLSNYLTIGFNTIKFDLPLIAMAINGYQPIDIYDACEKIIKQGLQPWQLGDHYDTRLFSINHIDLIEVAIGRASLKCYASRLHIEKLTNIPFEPGTVLTDEQIDTLKEYCHDDLLDNELLYNELKPDIDIRDGITKEYGIDVRSKSDAQIAEALLKHDLEKLGVKAEKPKNIPTEFFYTCPENVKFNDSILKDRLETIIDHTFRLAPGGSKFVEPAFLKELVTIGQTSYKMGLGGLHSTESGLMLPNNNRVRIIDRDVISYYPRIILNNNLYPDHLTSEFLGLFSSKVTERVQAKKSGNKQKGATFKIILNGSFGKFNNPYSILYSPQLLLQTTITGQLTLLMLIERLESAGIRVKSANTDGVVFLVPRSHDDVYQEVLHEWEIDTGYETEETIYHSYFGRDVNNYFAIKPCGEIKTKGLFGIKPTLSKTPTCSVIPEAVMMHLYMGIDYEQYILQCNDIRKFVACKNVAAPGAVYDGEPIGKVVRWYYAEGCEDMSIKYKANGNQVAGSLGAKTLMVLPDKLPNDIKYQYYLDSAEKLIKAVGVYSD